MQAKNAEAAQYAWERGLHSWEKGEPMRCLIFRVKCRASNLRYCCASNLHFCCESNLYVIVVRPISTLLLCVQSTLLLCVQSKLLLRVQSTLLLCVQSTLLLCVQSTLLSCVQSMLLLLFYLPRCIAQGTQACQIGGEHHGACENARVYA